MGLVWLLITVLLADVKLMTPTLATDMLQRRKHTIPEIKMFIADSMTIVATDGRDLFIAWADMLSYRPYCLQRIISGRLRAKLLPNVTFCAM